MSDTNNLNISQDTVELLKVMLHETIRKDDC